MVTIQQISLIFREILVLQSRVNFTTKIIDNLRIPKVFMQVFVVGEQQSGAAHLCQGDNVRVI